MVCGLQALAKSLTERGFSLVTGGTENHLVRGACCHALPHARRGASRRLLGAWGRD
jgi:hypothetical protein